MYIPYMYTGISVYTAGLPTRVAVHIRLPGQILRGHEGKWLVARLLGLGEYVYKYAL